MLAGNWGQCVQSFCRVAPLPTPCGIVEQTGRRNRNELKLVEGVGVFLSVGRQAVTQQPRPVFDRMAAVSPWVPVHKPIPGHGDVPTRPRKTGRKLHPRGSEH